MTTYTLKVTYSDGIGHIYTKLNRVRVAELAACAFHKSLDRPETVTVTTERDGRTR
jgi:hypothetical protein